MPAEDKQDIDLSEIKESLGTIMASFTYIYDPYAIIKEIDIIMSFEASLLDVSGNWTKPRWGEYGITVDIPQPRKTIDRMTGTSILMHSDEKKIQTVVVKNYKELFDAFRMWWESAVDAWNSQTGNWKQSIIICSKLRSDLFRIALKERLVSLRTGMYSIQMRSATAPPNEEFFAGNET
jgi:hypothetical protein